MSTKPLPFAKPRNETSPSMRSRKPGSTVDEPSVCTRPVVFSASSAADRELEADRRAEVRLDPDLDAGDEALAVDPEAAVDEVDAADRVEVHRAVDDQLDAGVRAGELDAGTAPRR